MPLFYFHTEDGEYLADENGAELNEVEEARDEAVQFLADSLNHDSDLFWRHRGYSVIVTEDRG
jgi:hypothetical protein